MSLIGQAEVTWYVLLRKLDHMSPATYSVELSVSEILHGESYIKCNLLTYIHILQSVTLLAMLYLWISTECQVSNNEESDVGLKK